MKPVYQTIMAPPHGNCLQACIASIFELDLDVVPNFMAGDGDWWDAYRQYLLKVHGVYPIAIPPDAFEPGLLPFGWHMIQGQSPRGDFDHIVVGYNGKPVHDPVPGGNCELRKIKYYEVFVATLESLFGPP